MQFLIDADSSYLVRGQIWFRGSTPGDLKHGFSAGGASIVRASGSSFIWGSAQADSIKTLGTGSCNSAPWDTVHLSTNLTRPVVMTTGAFRIPMRFVYTFKTGPTAGTFSVTWAQNASDIVNPAMLLAGSMIQYEKLP
jgi:hypothetical protein